MLKPFFTYYGGKWRAAPKYPQPEFPSIIEPFAGSAGYSLRYFDRSICLYDVDPIIASLWSYLIRVKSSEIMKLPLVVDDTEGLKVCQEAKYLIGFWLNKGSTSPQKTPSAWARSGIRPNSFWGESIRDRIASQVDSIRHWKVFNSSYEQAGNKNGTWFIDPPYDSKAGRLYRHKFRDYDNLATWCLSRKGQVIVCESAGADWLPFQDFCDIKSTEGSRGKSVSKEVVWYNKQDNGE